MNAAQRRLLQTARRAEDGHLDDARGAVLEHFRGLTLRQAEKALEAALSQPKAKRAQAVKGVLALIWEASATTRLPPGPLLGIMRAAVRDRVLNAQDFATLTDPTLAFGDTRELQARAVGTQRQDMNCYWAGESERFRDDAAKTVREAVRRGLTPDQAATLLEERLGVHHSRAVLIASVQLLTARAEQAVLKAAGVKEFQWQTMLDSRVRPEHAARQGRVYTWRSAPELPGSAVQCRCRAILSEGK
ncbi:phage minor head protein [Deinococcus ficus]|uniref:phage minor head protein n=1 Tax=Deinococcus ficus TaxID=317577 RepID=UPI00131C765F|nr:phage minor head protein [Deinococcus ficus]